MTTSDQHQAGGSGAGSTVDLTNEDDFSHYFNATRRLSDENAQLRAALEAAEREGDAWKAAHQTCCDGGQLLVGELETLIERHAAELQHAWARIRELEQVLIHLRDTAPMQSIYDYINRRLAALDAADAAKEGK